VYVDEPTEGEVDILVEKLKLDKGMLLDATDPYEVPRVEVDGPVTYMFTRVPYEEDGKVNTAPMLLGINQDCVFTVSGKKISIFNPFIEGKKEFHTTQKVRFLLTLFSEIDAQYARYITHINRDVRRLSSKLGTKISNEDIVSFVNFEAILNDLMDALVPTNSMLSRVLSGKILTLYENDKDYVEDVYLENGQLIELCRTNLRSIVNVRNAFSTIMSNDLNKVIKLLTGLTIVFTIPTIISSIYGMNIPLPFQESPHAFWIVTSMVVVMTVIVLWFFYRKKLL
jgi:magnesium transporter